MGGGLGGVGLVSFGCTWLTDTFSFWVAFKPVGAPPAGVVAVRNLDRSRASKRARTTFALVGQQPLCDPAQLATFFETELRASFFRC